MRTQDHQRRHVLNRIFSIIERNIQYPKNEWVSIVKNTKHIHKTHSKNNIISCIFMDNQEVVSREESQAPITAPNANMYTLMG